ncbi:helix-turn-helix domain-containing protein [Sutterella sp.]|uniref:helix-turn-helix domain-containing protein n=1 Tax=Sutterella sp. TaxID=1981025 RepID=UPI0026DED45D|nr:helix-turn-helix domain-containing protein [Sutterella sp.]MDO5530772.1 helix-turn-helix domain-containing protein [Sutterella sp.]
MSDIIRYSIDDLSRLTGLSVRTIRFYIQNGLADRPIGERRAAYYTSSHLEQLLRIRRLTDEGRSLDSIRSMMTAPETASEPAPRPGSVSVRSHIYIAPGISLEIDPEKARMNAQDVREFIRQIIEIVPKQTNG